MSVITTIVVILAPPAQVRKKFLDFSSIPVYKPTFFLSIESPNNTPSYDLRPGDGVRFTSLLKGNVSTNEAQVASNNPGEFSWQGGLPLGILKGVHTFRFESEDNGKETRFVHEEVFTGPLSFLFGEGFLAKLIGVKTAVEASYMGFNVDFRKWVENDDNHTTA